MFKTISTLCGIGLVVLWIAGLGSPLAAGWLTWLDGVAALCAFGMAAYTNPYTTRGAKVAMSWSLAAGLMALWIVGLSTNQVPWLVWWTFGFACVFLLQGIASAFGEKRVVTPYQGPTTLSTGDFERQNQRERERERERERRSA